MKENPKLTPIFHPLVILKPVTSAEGHQTPLGFILITAVIRYDVIRRGVIKLAVTHMQQQTLGPSLCLL